MSTDQVCYKSYISCYCAFYLFEKFFKLEGDYSFYTEYYSAGRGSLV